MLTWSVSEPFVVRRCCGPSVGLASFNIKKESIPYYINFVYYTILRKRVSHMILITNLVILNTVAIFRETPAAIRVVKYWE